MLASRIASYPLVMLVAYDMMGSWFPLVFVPAAHAITWRTRGIDRQLIQPILLTPPPHLRRIFLLPPTLDFAARLKALTAEALGRFEPDKDEGETQDLTMPTWGLRTPDIPLGEYDDESDLDQSQGRDELSNTQSPYAAPGDNARSRSLTPSSQSNSEPYGYDFSPTNYDYTSTSDADVDTDTSTHDPLDNLLPISPASSRPPTPHAVPLEDGQSLLDRQPMQDEAHSLPDAQPLSALLTSVPDELSETSRPSHGIDPEELPDALRAFREWILKQSSTGDLTTQAADSLLKTLNMCLENDFLWCGSEKSSGEEDSHAYIVLF
ncbi:hypothetical protein BDV93DRAFT_513358 [Ceratobasidium sp. AG-I]|nr:hypothetical protein BDV93DRAFT_513358 [Ceratobasidium sp. AG-I]